MGVEGNPSFQIIDVDADAQLEHDPGNLSPVLLWRRELLPLERDFARYLECGVLAHGFARVRCESCKDELLVAFSCKGRGVCPSCNAKRAHVTAVHLVERVLPRVPYRQWTLSFPHRVRWVLLKEAGLLSDVLTLFLRAVSHCSGGSDKPHEVPRRLCSRRQTAAISGPCRRGGGGAAGGEPVVGPRARGAAQEAHAPPGLGRTAAPEFRVGHFRLRPLRRQAPGVGQAYGPASGALDMGARGHPRACGAEFTGA
ncbi:transposase zinc-binding domain-containing protein [Hyalangium sp.]|uniref:transposase zinc-binding domain-containing protein n=1 Tax=Hyalangium sp. TaxID=2028555 RepID=UPI002D3D2774|nr:transposase zinc-binding domain-containing protein [Hyalangium sp.]HYH95520.1 transposase zinc-binding domain-containing protein [Hyalangium sp.]